MPNVADEIQRILKKSDPIIEDSREGLKTFKVLRPNYTLIISLDTSEYELQFDLKDGSGRSILSYHIDTDLYDLSNPKFRQFKQDIEADIVRFTQNLVDKKIEYGQQNNKQALLIPSDGEYLLITKGKFWNKTTIFKSKDKAYRRFTRHSILQT